MTASALELVGMLAACGAAAAALVLRERRARVGAIAVALVIAPVLVVGDVWNEARVIDFRTSAAQVALAVVLACGIVAALTWAFLRYREAFPIVAIAVLPLRVPLEIGGETANLLVPLYAVIAAGALAAALRPPALPPEGSDPWAQRLRWVLAATLVLYAIQASYSVDVSNAIENIGFFLVPFAVLFCLLAEVEWSRRAPTAHADRRRDRDGCVCRDRDRPVLRARPLLQPGAVRRQPAPCLLPGQLDLLRPEHLRPLPRPRADGDGRVRGVGQGSP